MLGTKPLLLSLLGVSTIGGVVTGGYFLFKSETSTVAKDDKTINANNTAVETQTDLTTKVEDNDRTKPTGGQDVSAPSIAVRQEPVVAARGENQTGRQTDSQN